MTWISEGDPAADDDRVSAYRVSGRFQSRQGFGSRSKPANADPKEMEKVSEMEKISADRVSKSIRFRKWKTKPTRGIDEGEKKTTTRGTREM
ncbi:hypothetical protein ACLOJK_023345 [Asimina triloba]